MSDRTELRQLGRVARIALLRACAVGLGLVLGGCPVNFFC